MQTYPYEVARVQKEMTDTVTLSLIPCKGSPKIVFAPGQFNMLYVFGVGEIPISISGDPGKADVLVHTTRAVGAVSRAICALKRGDTLGVRGPYGTAWPLERSKGKDILFVAGGIGLAPLRPMIYRVLSHRDDYGKVAILYGARTPQDILYPKLLEQWKDKHHLDVHVTVDRAGREWRGNVGVVTTLISNVTVDPVNTVAMMCGPEVMMRFTIQDLLVRGIKADAIAVSMERNMKCGIGVCGHCQYGQHFVCKDGPVFWYPQIKAIFGKAEI